MIKIQINNAKFVFGISGMSAIVLFLVSAHLNYMRENIIAWDNKYNYMNNTDIETYGILVSNCNSFMWAMYTSLNVFKVDKLDDDDIIYPMNIFWIEQGNGDYLKLMEGNKSVVFMDKLKQLIFESNIDNDIILNNNNFDIKFLIKNDLIQIPSNYLKIKPVYYAWRCAFNKLLLFDKQNQFKHYKSILMLDSDIFFTKSIKHLFKTANYMNTDLMITTVINKRDFDLNGGITLIKPNKTIFDEILSIQKNNSNSNNTQLLTKIYTTSEQTFYEYLFNITKKGNISQRGNINLLSSNYGAIVYGCDSVDNFDDVMSWHFTMGPKPWHLTTYDHKLNETKITFDHWYIQKYYLQYFNQTYNNQSFLNMTNQNCKFVILEKWNRELYNKYYTKMKHIGDKCNMIRNSIL